MAETILFTFKDKKIFEAGIGNGDFVKLANIRPEKYYGVDPSKKLLLSLGQAHLAFIVVAQLSPLRSLLING